MQRRLSGGVRVDFAAVLVGLLVILSPLLVARLLALGGWPLTPVAVILVGVGFAVELLAWASGFGAMLMNAFTRLAGAASVPWRGGDESGVRAVSFRLKPEAERVESDACPLEILPCRCPPSAFARRATGSSTRSRRCWNRFPGGR